MTSSFTPRDPSEVTRLVQAYPLCWIVSGGPDDRLSTPLPLLAETGVDGGVQSLFGHISLANPQYAALRMDSRASILCMGPQGYISPGLVSNPTWGPTWNYAVARFEVDLHFVPDETDAALTALARALEGDGTGDWTPQRMGPRYDELKKRIIAFRAHVRAAHPRFKLGQDERDETFEEIVDGLADTELAAWMRRARG